ASREEVDEAEEAALVLLEILLQFVGIDPGRGNMPAQAVDRQHGQGEPDPPPQIRNTKDVGELLPHYCNTSNLPPALVIFSCADLENLWACTVSALDSSPSPRILTGRLVLMTPALRNTSGVMGSAPRAAPSAA